MLFWSLVGTMVLAALLVAATFWLAQRTNAEEELVRHTLAVRNQIANVVILMQRAETSQRGYLLTGRQVYVAPYEAAAAALPGALDTLARLVADNPHHTASLDRLRKLAKAKLAELRITINEREAGHPEQALEAVNTDAGLGLMDSIRETVSGMQSEEDRLLRQRQSASAVLDLLLQVGVAVAFALICIVGALVIFVTRRSFSALAAAHDQLVVTNEQLVEQVNRREQAESQLRQSQKMEAIGQLTGGIAHDFNNMLGVITGSIDLIKRRVAQGDFGIERFLEAASQASARAAALTHRLLAFARQQPLSPQAVDANRMIANMSDLLRSTLGEHIRIETVSAGGLWLTKADAHQLENVILNIAINARDAMPEGGKLTVETSNAYLDEAYCRQHPEIEPGQFVMIALTDTGAGMTPEVIARAFDPFFTTKPVGAGTGLGLSQVYGFVKQSQGHINIYSEVGAGTTVKVYLPRLFEADKEVALQPAMPVEPVSTNEVILVVEDDGLMRQLSSEGLRELGYTVFDCGSAAEALAVLDRTPDVKLLFTDVVMPEVNGKKLADEALRRHPGLKVLFTTGYTPNAVVHGGVLDPGVQFISKPFTLDQLADKVRAALGD
jgi:signal transduction histidine kinase